MLWCYCLEVADLEWLRRSELNEGLLLLRLWLRPRLRIHGKEGAGEACWH